MCEMLVRTVDKVSADPVKDALLSKRGNVIAIKPDGHEWTQRELTNPHWVVVREPKLSIEEAEKYLAPGPSAIIPSAKFPQDRSKDTAVRLRRQFNLDIAALPKIKSLRVEAAASAREL